MYKKSCKELCWGKITVFLLNAAPRKRFLVGLKTYKLHKQREQRKSVTVGKSIRVTASAPLQIKTEAFG